MSEGSHQISWARVAIGLLTTLVTAAMLYFLDTPYKEVPALGRLLDPFNGFWANAEPVNGSFNQTLRFPSLKGSASLYFDERMVPHIYADNDHDIYFMEGYVHACFRLWQMDMETRAAAGRVSEVVGSKALNYDHNQRRKGMVYAAENSLKAMEAEPRTKTMLDAYTEGINTYIGQLTSRSLPLEYKLMGFKPEPWTNIKSALLMKYMADDLTGECWDIPLTYLKQSLPPAIFSLLYPEKEPGSSPVIPAGTHFDSASLSTPPVPNDSALVTFTSKDFGEAREDAKGSNNWALSGNKTQSGAAILCNDPHLGLNLPALWFEVQLHSPDMNVYGASLPGAPGVIIGFTDSISWGFTNNYRDVKDYYLIKRVAGTSDKYWMNGMQRTMTPRVERIAIKGKADFLDTVYYTVHGPVTYDERHPAAGGIRKPLAMCWMGHRGSNELLGIYLMNRAKSYAGFVDGIFHFECPAQNMVYADRQGNIALWGQGQFIDKWQGQGRFVMNGADTAALWAKKIPMRENPHVFNPAQGYVASANQSVTDSAYPYWYNGDFRELRAWRINDRLSQLQKATVKDMFDLQNDTYSILASQVLPYMLKHVPASLDSADARYISKLRKWNYQLSATSTSASLFQIWWYYLDGDIWEQLGKAPDALHPADERTMRLIATTDSEIAVIPQLKDFHRLVQQSFRKAMDSLHIASRRGREWYQVKNTSLTHLAKLAAFSYDTLKIGGWGNVVNAAKTDHGPSWRMVVQMGQEIEAYGIYPGGQSGNPGSKYYSTFIKDWAAGKYYRLLFIPFNSKPSASQTLFTWTAQPQRS